MTTSVSSVTSHFPSAENGFTTTLSGTIAPGAVTVGLNSVAGYTNGEIAVFVVAPTVASEKQVFTGTIDTGGIQVTGVVWTSGTDQTHVAGTTVVDYATATHISMISKGIQVQHNQDGTHKAITAPSVTSAGAISGTALTATSYTQGSTRLDTGWFPGSSTWTYVSATTFTVSAGEAAFMSVGTKIWFTQTTSKYFYVTGVSGTTITVNGGTDYTVANAAITAPYYSNAETPYAFPNWFAFTPTWTNVTLGSSTQSTYFTMVGKTVTMRVSFSFGAGSSVSGVIAMSLPVTASSNITANTGFGSCFIDDNGVGAFYGIWVSATTTTAAIYVPNTTTSTIYVQATAGKPGTWSSGDVIKGTLTYQAA